MSVRRGWASVEAIARELDCVKEGEGYSCFCPAHDDTKKRSLSLNQGRNGKPVFNCFVGCSFEAIFERLPEHLKPGGVGEDRGSVPWPLYYARKAFDEARTLSARPHPYFLSRGLDTTQVPGLDQAVRIDPHARRTWKPVKSKEQPALIAALVDLKGTIAGAQRTFLNAAESAKDGVEPVRKSAASVKGNAIRLGPPAETVMLAEGLETAMTAAVACGGKYPAWASAGVGVLGDMELPPIVRTVIVLAENDRASRDNLARVAERFGAKGIKVRVARPPEGAKDFNDVVCRKADNGSGARVPVADLNAAYTTVREIIEAAEDFTPSSGENGWAVDDYRRGESGGIINCAYNIALALSKLLATNHNFRFNLLAGRPEILRPLPTHTDLFHPFPRTITDGDHFAIRLLIQQFVIPLAKKEDTMAAVYHLAAQSCYHPFRDTLETLKWDGTKRLRELWSIYFGAQRTRYTMLTARYFMVSMVARAYRPGCKVDYVVILAGTQGDKKSDGLKALVGDDYFSATIPDLHTKDAMLGLSGWVLIEWSELITLLRSDNETAKAFITRTHDDFRAPYGKEPERRPRTAIFAGTTNREEHLLDETGNRRYWSIGAGKVDLDALRRDRDQLWAEAVHYFKLGWKWWPGYGAEARYFAAEQEDRVEGDAWDEKIVDWVVLNAPEGGWEPREGFTMGDVALGALGFRTLAEFKTSDQNRMRRCFVRLGIVRRKGEDGKAIRGTKGRTWVPLPGLYPAEKPAPFPF